jgi:hypothetical protein
MFGKNGGAKKRLQAMDPLLAFLVVLGAMFLFALIYWASPENQAAIKARDPDRAAKDRKEAAERQAAEEARWKQIERDFALSCVTQVQGLPCSGLAVPIKGTKDRYRCPICGGQFVGAPHGW